MDYKLKKCIIWSFVFIIIETMLVTILKYNVDHVFLYICFIGLVYMLINAFCIKYHRERLFINGIISFITVVLFGVLAGLNLEVKDVIAIGVAISLIDVLSFTKAGKRTMNAKAMSNVNFMSKLIVYGIGKEDALYPTCGIGDYFYFALWLAGLGKSIKLLLLLGVGLFVGNFINKVIVLKLSKRTNYRGIPATIIPFICILSIYFLASLI